MQISQNELKKKKPNTIIGKIIAFLPFVKKLYIINNKEVNIQYCFFDYIIFNYDALKIEDEYLIIN